MYTIENKFGLPELLTEAATPSHPTAARAARALRVRLLADDVTGACDAGAAFLAAGHSVRVWFGARALYATDESAQAFHTASRDLTADRAAEAVAQAAQSLARDANTLLFKKVDSAGRGPIGAELLAAQRVLGTKTILFAPAFPVMGRTVRNGVLEIRDASGETRQLQIAGLFPAEIRDAMASISSADAIAAAVESGKKLLLCDSETQQDLDALACAAEPLNGLLYAGSAGLARAVAGLHPAPAPEAPKATAARILVIAGSPHPVTKLQLEHLESGASPHSNIQVLRIACERGDELLIRAACDAFDPEALILTGGETAQLAAESLGADSILLHGELVAGTPWGTLQGGRAQGRIAVTKSGGFGAISALSDAIRRLSGGA
jgi:D-threonate/D-erythronate kinase